MALRPCFLKLAAVGLPALLLAGCVDEPPRPAAGTVVFRGSLAATGVTPNAFGGSRLNALSIDTYQTLDGRPSIRIDVPAASANPGFAGGPFTAAAAADLSDSTALVFWAKAARPAVLDKVGFGLNFAPIPTTHQVTVFGLPLTTEWTRHFIPIPDPARLTAERGLFWFAESDPAEYSFWLADLAYTRVSPALLDMQPGIGAASLTLAVGKTGAVPVTLTYADFDGTRRALDAGDPGAGPPASFLTFTSSDPAVVTVDANGTLTGAAVGQARVGARLGPAELPADMLVTVVAALPTAPAEGPPAPTLPASEVKSLFSDAYPAATSGIVFGTNFGVPDPARTAFRAKAEVRLAGNTVERFDGLRFAGVDFSSNAAQLVDVSGMSFLHVDVWTPDASKFGVQLVGFPQASAAGLGPSVPQTLSFNGRATYLGTIPPIAQSTWIGLDIPLALFGDLPLAKIGQLLFLDNGAVAGGGVEGGTFYIDNVYFHR